MVLRVEFSGWRYDRIVRKADGGRRPKVIRAIPVCGFAAARNSFLMASGRGRIVLIVGGDHRREPIWRTPGHAEPRNHYQRSRWGGEVVSLKIGRIGRRAFAISFLGTLACMGILMMPCVWFYNTQYLPSPIPEATATVLLIGATVILFVLCVGRVRDIGRPRWWPAGPLGILMLFVLPGAQGDNRDGAPPSGSSRRGP